MSTPIKYVPVAKFKKQTDLETHVRLAEIDNNKFVLVTDYIPSLNQHGRGYSIPYDNNIILEFISALVAIVEGDVKI
jgi:hypothetical protein